jgi:hypothetical protein
MAKLADAADLKSAGLKRPMRVQIPPPAARCVWHLSNGETLRDEEWTNLASTPNAVHRFVFVPRGRSLSFYVTFVLDQSGERAYAMWERSVFSVQMGGKRSKEFGADELEAWPSQFLVPNGFAAAKLAEIAQFACTDPTQPKSGTLSAIKTIRYKSFITRSE